MSGKLTIKNNNNTEYSIIHEDGLKAKAISTKDIAIAVNTINDFPSNANDGDVVIVRDPARGGTFIYDSSKVSEHNDGTNFNGFIRQFSGPVNVKWFGAKEANGNTSINMESTNEIQKALDYVFLNGLELLIDGNYTVRTLVLPQNNTIENPILKISGIGNAINYTSKNLKGTLNAVDDLDDNILLDLRYNENIPKRMSIIIENLNIFGRTITNGNGMYISNTWFTLDKVCISGFKEGLIQNEVYKSSITNCSISNNKYGIVYSGYNSVVNIIGTELRNNKLDTQGSSLLLNMSSRLKSNEIHSNECSINQVNISGNNFESSYAIIEVTNNNSTITGVNYSGNYDEGNEFFIKKSCDNYKLSNCNFSEIKYGCNIDLDYTDGLILGGTIGDISTTDATGNIKFINLPYYFGNKKALRNTNRILPTTNINKDYDFSMQSRVLSPVTLPSDMGNSNVHSYCSWETDNDKRFIPGKTCLKIDNTSDDTLYLRWDFRIKGVKSFYNMNPNYAYRINVAYTYFTESNKTLVFGYQRPNDSSEQYIYRGCKAGWNTDIFTIDIKPDEPTSNMHLKLYIDSDSSIMLDNFIISYISTPELIREKIGFIGASIPSNDSINITIDNWETDLLINILGDQNINYWYERGDSDNILKLHQGDSGNTSYPYITYTEKVNRII